MSDRTLTRTPTVPSLGLRENLSQFSLLVVINAFVGMMAGMERSILPVLAEQEFGVSSRAVILSFLVTFGIAKAVTNIAAGRTADRFGRRRTLLTGWIAGLPVPFMIMFAPGWAWVVAANVLLGINQGLCWSAAIIMKVDLVGPKRRGLAIGLNESSGYLAVSAAALATGYLATQYGLRPVPFLLGVGAAVAGLGCSLFTRETLGHARLESSAKPVRSDHLTPPGSAIFRIVSWRHAPLRAVSQGGLVNNLNDGVSWGLFPLFFASRGLDLNQTAALCAVYPAVWGLGQIATGALSDRCGRRWPMTTGMALQGVALVMIAVGHNMPVWATAMTGLAIGSALVYPTFLGAVSDHSDARWRASAIGVYRWWRDLGYAAGALIAGVVADAFGVSVAISVVGIVTIVSGAVLAADYREPVPLDYHYQRA